MESQPRRRRRPARSCIECRRRKIRCDRNDPCTRCVSAHTQCTYRLYSDQPKSPLQPREGTSRHSALCNPLPLPSSPIHPSRDDPPSSTDHSQPLEPRTTETPTPAETPHYGSLFPGQIDNKQPGRATNAESAITDLLRRVQRLEQSSAQTHLHDLSETGRGIFGPRSQPEDLPWIFTKSRVMRWSLWMGTAKEFEPFVAFYAEAIGKGNGETFKGAEIKHLLVQSGDLLQKCKHTARSIKIWRPSRSLSNPQLGLKPPSRDISDIMVTLYMQSFESTHRILHIPSFWAEYQRYWNDLHNAPNELRLKVLLVIGIGSSLHKQENADIGFQIAVHQWVYAAQAWLSGPLEKDRLSISALQIDCLTILARQIFSIGADLVWTSMGSLVHKAMQINLHRDPKHLSGISVFQAEVRRRLWTTIIEMAAQSSLDSAMPAGIPESDTEAPSNINDDEIDETTTVLQPHPKGAYTAASFQILLLDSLPARLRILRLLTSLNTQISYLDVLALSSELSNATRAYHSFMKENPSSSITPFHRNLLDYLVRRFMIPLHCHFTSKARTNPLFTFSLKVSLETAMAIISPEPDEGFSKLMANGGGVFREGTWCAMTVIAIELLAQLEAQRIDGTRCIAISIISCFSNGLSLTWLLSLLSGSVMAKQISRVICSSA
ncbi:unnamed protein product [Penicillium egyptiacum]|uniref:Zn(2)-C6 fungal-type domain-containing protein n=1 Tax=Penicillium egyptiacum TaxID=1303716 RepID=A0A9W4P6M9_9EURO|nr:unnamed protein product [Penicillium egyptiacum]